MGHSLKIDGDFSSVKKGVMEVGKEIQKMGKAQKMSLFSKEDIALLNRQTLDVTKALGQELNKVNKNAERYKAVIKSTNVSETRRVKAAKEYNKLLKDRMTIQKTIDQANGTGQTGPGRASKLKAGIGGMGRGLTRIPGMGRMAGMGGLGLMGGLGMVGGAALGLGAMKGIQGYQQFKGGAHQRLMMKARGIDNTSGINKDAAKLGLTPEQVRERQLKGAAAFGEGGGSQEGVVQRAQFEKARGLEKGSMIEMGQGLRGAMGEKSAQEAMFKLQAVILSKEITSNIGPFLETSAHMLTAMNEQGLPVDNELLALFGSMVKGGTSEKRAMQQIMSVNQAVKGSSGDSNAFLQSMFSQEGIGGGTVGGSQEAIRMGGLFGTSADKLSSQFGMSESQIESYKKLGLTGEGTGFGARSKGMLDFADQNFGSSPQEDLRKGEFFKQIFGTQTGAESLGFLNKMKGAQGDEKKMAKIEKELKEASKSPEQKMQEKVAQGIEDLKGIDSSIEANTGRQALKMEEIGQSLGATGIMIEESLTSIDSGVSAIAKFLTGHETPKERQQKLESERQQSFNTGLKSMGTSQDAIRNMTPEQQQEQLAKAKGAVRANTQAQKDFKPIYNQRTGFQSNRGGREKLKEEQMKLVDAMTAIQIIMKENVAVNKAVAKNTKGSGGKAMGSKTRGRN